MTKPLPRPIHLYTVPEVADQLKVSQKQVRRWIKSRDLIALQLGRQLRIADSDLRAFLAQRRMV